MDRTKGIGGTDIAAIVGLNPWKSPIDVYMEKLGLVEEQEDNDNLWFGREMELVLQKRYEQETGLKVYEPNLFQHIEYDWYVGTPDGIIPPDGGVDYKTTGYAKKDDWGEPGSDEVPAYYHTQAMWYMGLTGAQWWDIGVLFMGARREFKIYRINRDEELIATLIEKGKEFWENFVIPQIPPPVDASPGWDKFFKAKWPKEEEDYLESSDMGELLITHLKGYEADKKRIEASLTECQNRLKEMIGDHAGIKSILGRVQWKATKDRTVVDWEKVAKYFSRVDNEDEFKKIVNVHTTVKPGPRVFKAYWNKEKD